MIFAETKLKGAFIIVPEKLSDERGFFARMWCRRELEAHGLNPDLAQCNLAYNYRRGTIRGMHFQVAPHQEAKLVRCTKGIIYDVIIDLRPDSPTFKSWIGVELSEHNHKMLYVPEGFGHGYQTLTDGAELFYQVSEFYAPNAEGGVRWNDPCFSIDWPLKEKLTISDKDQNWPDFRG